MMKTWLAAAAALAMMTGGALAQGASTSSSSTWSSTTDPAVAPTGTHESRSERTTSSDGVVTDKTNTYSSGTTTAPTGEMDKTEKSTKTTTVR